MNPKKLIQDIGNSSLSSQERMYRLLVTLGLVGLAAGIAAGAVAGENINNLLAMILALAVIFGITYFTIWKT